MLLSVFPLALVLKEFVFVRVAPVSSSQLGLGVHLANVPVLVGLVLRNSVFTLHVDLAPSSNIFVCAVVERRLVQILVVAIFQLLLDVDIKLFIEVSDTRIVGYLCTNVRHYF